MTYSANSATIGADISPVYAPLGFSLRFCAPSFMGVFCMTVCMSGIDVNGGHRTMSTF